MDFNSIIKSEHENTFFFSKNRQRKLLDAETSTSRKKCNFYSLESKAIQYHHRIFVWRFSRWLVKFSSG